MTAVDMVSVIEGAPNELIVSLRVTIDTKEPGA